jgi:competence protein ComFC
MREMRRFFLDIIFPVFCVGCKREEKYICDECSLFLTESSLICPICREDSYTGKRHKACSGKYGLDGLVSVWDYDGVIKKCISILKYEDIYHMGEELMEKACKVILKDESRFSDFLTFITKEEVVITFVPRSTKKREEKLEIRRFSVSSEGIHAEILAKNLAKIVNKKEKGLLLKKKETKKQVDLEKEERMTNLKGAFIAKDENLPLKAVLVDDVFTSGSTMKECAKTLKMAGIKEVWGFTLTKTS